MIVGNLVMFVYCVFVFVVLFGVWGIELKVLYMLWRIVWYDDCLMDNFGEFELKSNCYDK